MCEFLNLVKDKYSEEEYTLIEKAYHFADDAHKDQIRESCDAYIMHPVEVAKILLEMDIDAPTVAAGLLHDVAEDTDFSIEKLTEIFGEEVAGLVDGVTKLSRLEFFSREEQQAESLRKMLLAMAKDIRVVLIRLADRLHNMRTLHFCSKEKQIRISKETLDIYAPLAHRLGISNVKSELEDLCLYYLEPESYKNIEEMLAMHHDEREQVVQDIISLIQKRLKDAKIDATIEGRPKHYYSIYRKMKNQNKSFDQIYDLTAIRIIVNSVIDCYAVLGIVHTLWKPIPGRFKDYIAMPKQNMYQSLHTTLLGKNGNPFEVQIRTWDMHRIAEYGIAAHWKYKESRNDSSDLDEKLKWLRQVLEWQNDSGDSIEFMNTLKMDLFADQVFVFSPKGMVVELPQGANPIDFAYRIHSNIGNKCVGAKVNGRIVQLDTPLKNGEIVEIITSNTSRGPSRDWLSIVKTPQARSKIRAWLKKERREENIERGKTMLEASAKKSGVSFSQLMRPDWLEPILIRQGFSSMDDLYASVGFGAITTSQVLTKLLENYRAEIKKKEAEENAEKLLQESDDQSRVVHEHAKKDDHGIIVKGQDNMLVRISKCCSPVPPDPIIGFITRGRGVSVHREDCPNIQDLMNDPDRFIEVEWEKDSVSSYQADLHLDARDKPGLLVEISSIISNMGMRMMSINAKVDKNNMATFIMAVEVKNKSQLDQLVKKFKSMPDTIRIFRTNS